MCGVLLRCVPVACQCDKCIWLFAYHTSSVPNSYMQVDCYIGGHAFAWSILVVVCGSDHVLDVGSCTFMPHIQEIRKEFPG